MLCLLLSLLLASDEGKGELGVWGSREALSGDDVAGRVGRITVEGAVGACVEVRGGSSGCAMRVRNLYG